MAVALALSLAAASYTLPSGTPTTAGHHCRLRRPTCVATEDATAGNSLESEVGRRRNLAIISHPDAGKTTLTEKLLLYGGAINQAGAVKAKGEQRRATSDFMELEQQRGISISSSVLSYEYDGKVVSILDTPGHQDFSEDTYRTLSAADNAVMLVDAAKGLEPQTRKLFEVAHLRRLPLFTFVNKMDRPALSPFEIIDQIENEFGLVCSPVLWPIGSGDRFKGVLDRTNDQVRRVELRGVRVSGRAGLRLVLAEPLIYLARTFWPGAPLRESGARRGGNRADDRRTPQPQPHCTARTAARTHRSPHAQPSGVRVGAWNRSVRVLGAQTVRRRRTLALVPSLALTFPRCSTTPSLLHSSATPSCTTRSSRRWRCSRSSPPRSTWRRSAGAR